MMRFVAWSLLVLGGHAAKLRAEPAYFISLDGLQADLLTDLDAAQKLNAPHGLHWLLARSLVADRAWPVVTTMTSVSHLSTITCSPPSRHGVVANNYFVKGTKVNGFKATFNSEPLWRAAMRQGRKVLSLAYVGSGGGRAERSADYGLAYPDDAFLTPAQDLRWDLTQLPQASGWIGNKPHPSAREARLPILLNPVSKEVVTLDVLLTDGSASIEVATNKNLQTAKLGELDEQHPLDLYLKESTGRKRRITLSLEKGTAHRLNLHVSPAFYNNAYPETFRQQLDAADLVWPPSSQKIDGFLTQVAQHFVPSLGVDIVLFYQPLIDSVGHVVQGQLPRPFHANGSDPATVALVKAYQTIDQNLSDLLSHANDSTVVAVMGDHGMDAAVHAVNAAALLPKSRRTQAKEAADVLVSSALMLLYAKPGHEDVAEALGTQLAQALAKQRAPNGKPVLAESLHKGDFVTGRSSDYHREWQYGEAIWAFMGASGYPLAFAPERDEVFIAPASSGMHGTSLKVPTMATALLIGGAGMPRGHLVEASLIDAVPTFSKLIGIDPPRGCLGHVLP